MTEKVIVILFLDKKMKSKQLIKKNSNFVKIFDYISNFDHQIPLFRNKSSNLKLQYSIILNVEKISKYFIRFIQNSGFSLSIKHHSFITFHYLPEGRVTSRVRVKSGFRVQQASHSTSLIQMNRFRRTAYLTTYVDCIYNLSICAR